LFLLTQRKRDREREKERGGKKERKRETTETAQRVFNASYIPVQIEFAFGALHVPGNYSHENNTWHTPGKIIHLCTAPNMSVPQDSPQKLFFSPQLI
jgi:hypothetical protein